MNFNQSNLLLIDILKQRWSLVVTEWRFVDTAIVYYNKLTMGKK